MRTTIFMSLASCAQKARNSRVESPLIKRLPRGHRQFLSVLNAQGKPLGEALLSAEHDTLEVNAEVAEEPDPQNPAPRSEGSSSWAWNTS